MKKGLSLILTAVIIIALLIMGIMEKALSKTGSNLPIIIVYSAIAVLLIVLYLKARKDAAKSAENESDTMTDKNELPPSDNKDDE